MRLRNLSEVVDSHSVPLCQPHELFIHRNKCVEAADNVQVMLNRAPENNPPAFGQASSRGRDADEKRVGFSSRRFPITEQILETLENRDLASVSKNVLCCLSSLCTVDDAENLIAKVDDCTVCRLRTKRAEVPLRMFYGGVYLNIILAVFNLIPIPPLDGSHVVASLLPERIGLQYRQIGFLGIFLVILLMRNTAFYNFFGTIVSTIAFPFESIIRALI